jgi:hypothetical protein
MVGCTLVSFLLMAAFPAQDAGQRTSSFFDDSAARTFAPGSILLEGEVENPGPVDLTRLPLHGCPVKEVALENGKPKFRGAYFYRGYSLYDILSTTSVKKDAGNTFAPFVDLYVEVGNAKGEVVAVSWGEIFYAKDHLRIQISKSVQGINPSKLAGIQWPLPDGPSLVCAGDLFNFRFLENPTRITVRSVRGTFAAQKPPVIYAPEIQLTAGATRAPVRELGSALEQRKYSLVGYGHGTGFKGLSDLRGYLLKDILAAHLKLDSDDLRRGVAVISAKDGYRCAFSVSEIMNRNDNQDFLLLDRKESREDGRYSLLAAADFFVDRNVRAVERIDIRRVK